MINNKERYFMNVTLKNGKQGTLTVDTKAQKTTLTVDGITYLIAFVRDNKTIIKSDLFLNDGDMAMVRNEMQQFIKKVDNGKKRK